MSNQCFGDSLDSCFESLCLSERVCEAYNSRQVMKGEIWFNILQHFCIPESRTAVRSHLFKGLSAAGLWSSVDQLMLTAAQPVENTSLVKFSGNFDQNFLSSVIMSWPHLRWVKTKTKKHQCLVSMSCTFIDWAFLGQCSEKTFMFWLTWLLVTFLQVSFCFHFYMESRTTHSAMLGLNNFLFSNKSPGNFLLLIIISVY